MFALGMDAYIVAGLIPAIGDNFNKNSAEIGQGVTVFTFILFYFSTHFSTLLAKNEVKNILILAISVFSLAI